MTVATISKDFTFSASHQLDGLAPEHPCSRLHGHNYTVRVAITGEVDEVGFVFDYRRLDHFKRWLDQTFDHRHLNDVLPSTNPTAENLADFILEVLTLAADTRIREANIFHLSIGVSETEKTWATVGRHTSRTGPVGVVR